MNINMAIGQEKIIKEFNTFYFNSAIAWKWGGWYTTPYDKLNLKAQWDDRRDEIVYILYEFDGWPQSEIPAILKTKGGYVNGKYTRNSMSMVYRSEQDPYAMGSFNYYQGSVIMLAEKTNLMIARNLNF